MILNRDLFLAYLNFLSFFFLVPLDTGFLIRTSFDFPFLGETTRLPLDLALSATIVLSISESTSFS